MEAKSTDRKTFQLLDNGEPLGELIYENLFFMKAEIKLASSEVYEVRHLGFFRTSMTVTKDGAEIVSLKMNWRGQIVFAFHDGQEFVLKTKGLFNAKYVIENKENQQLMQFDPTFNWSKFHYNYAISYDSKPQDALFVLLGVYACNYYIASMSGAVAGM